MRKKRENILLAGLWYGNTKPKMNKFFNCIREELDKLGQGIQVVLPYNGSINFRGLLLTGTCDTPARCECLNFLYFNGHYGCSFCLCQGESVPIENQNHVFAFPYSNDVTLRTAQNTQEYARTITVNENPVMGVKGLSVLSQFMPDFIKGTGLDRMHGVEGGIVKKMLNLFFSVEYRARPFSLYRFIDIINERLQSIKPPKFVHRMPRSLSDVVHWKSSELKLWFFLLFCTHSQRNTEARLFRPLPSVSDKNSESQC